MTIPTPRTARVRIGAVFGKRTRVRIDTQSRYTLHLEGVYLGWLGWGDVHITGGIEVMQRIAAALNEIMDHHDDPELRASPAQAAGQPSAHLTGGGHDDL
jgi:hypothetical protein